MYNRDIQETTTTKLNNYEIQQPNHLRSSFRSFHRFLQLGRLEKKFLILLGLGCTGVDKVADNCIIEKTTQRY